MELARRLPGDILCVGNADEIIAYPPHAAFFILLLTRSSMMMRKLAFFRLRLIGSLNRREMLGTSYVYD